MKGDGYIRDLLRRLRDAGWTICDTVLGSGHRELIAPTGARVVISSSASDHRAMRKIEKNLRAHGFDTSRVHKPKAKRKSAA